MTVSFDSSFVVQKLTVKLQSFPLNNFFRLLPSQRGVFKPLIKNYSKELAALATFVASGLIHEYVLAVLSYSVPGGKEDIKFDFNKPSYGLHLAFFLYNGILIRIEYAFMGTIFHQKIVGLSLPSPLLTFIVIGTALPIAHWFTEEYVKCGVYDSLKVGCPMIVPIT